MKRNLLIIITVFIALFFFGCVPNKKDSLLTDDARFEEEEIKYEIEQILFSKSFQSIEPSVEIMTNNNKLKILASLGLSECSGININSIIKKGSEVNIHVSGIYDKKLPRLVVPQVIMEIKKSQLKKVEDLKFNIVYDDYEPLKIKYGINDVLNKIQSHFKISTKNSPNFNLIRAEDNTIVWDISYNNIFDKDNPETPLVNLYAKVNANTGDIINSEKVSISSSLDNGHILNYVNDGHILYKKSLSNKDTNETIEQLWVYDDASNEKIMLYSSNFKISSAQFSTNLNYVSLIEVSDSGTGLYIIPLEDKRAYKISFEDKFSPQIMKWDNKGILYLIENDDHKSIIYSYNVKNNKTNIIGVLNKNIENIVAMDNTFLITEKNQDMANKIISLTNDWKEFKLIGYGFNPKFVDKNIISYLHKDEKKDTNSLVFYNNDKNAKSSNLKCDNNLNYEAFSNEKILNYSLLPKGDIIYVRKNANNNFTLCEYSISNIKTETIANLIGDKAYYNEEKKLIYLNIVLPFDNEKTEMIYSIDLNKLN
ncbi:hypothetical protein SAMN02745784_01372 [Tissierella praeacuta DSM 18095]|uniref:Uncharacterized protein n=1 Tax=Tissierella praeacuta DSM 18095 TaxID=1123404 RepID=A0A1M4V6K1_9FIRM|nr:hypothetical protein [Tissierella praeacuta]TCU74100.1 hypothetical protein EV204_104134 [Tissierella praeacuta]SHE64532.1 hypothetical protein SAMN02745784_01372 [Tissierella praeacuta DSM 18095]SUP02946.1 Uncharacterised protein [Tissierella praeacuta]